MNALYLVVIVSNGSRIWELLSRWVIYDCVEARCCHQKMAVWWRHDRASETRSMIDNTSTADKGIVEPPNVDECPRAYLTESRPNSTSSGKGVIESVTPDGLKRVITRWQEEIVIGANLSHLATTRTQFVPKGGYHV